MNRFSLETIEGASVRSSAPGTPEERGLKARCLGEVRRIVSAAGTVGPPFLLEPLLRNLGIAEIRTRPLSHDARIVLEDGRFIIDVNGLLHSAYRRFCIAHELGHLMVNRYAQEGMVSTDGHDPEIENLCDLLGRELLMPIDPIRRHFAGTEIRCCPILRAAAIFDVPVDMMVARVLGDLESVPGTSALILRSDRAKSHPEWEARLASVWPSRANMEMLPFHDPGAWLEAISGPLRGGERQETGDPFVFQDNAHRCRVEACSFDRLRLAGLSENGVLLLVAPA